MSTTHVIQNDGYPVSCFLNLFVIEGEDIDTITQIDVYHDEACTKLIVDDMRITNFSAEAQQNIYHALYVKQCGERDRQRFHALIDKAQANLRTANNRGSF